MYIRKERVRYSESFKLKVIDSIESGKYSTTEAKEIYGIKGSSTISNWLKKYGRTDLLSKVIKVQTREEIDELNSLKKHNEELKRALAETQLRLLKAESTVKAANNYLGYDIEKKYSTRPYQ